MRLQRKVAIVWLCENRWTCSRECRRISTISPFRTTATCLSRSTTQPSSFPIRSSLLQHVYVPIVIHMHPLTHARYLDILFPSSILVFLSILYPTYIKRGSMLQPSALLNGFTYSRPLHRLPPALVWPALFSPADFLFVLAAAASQYLRWPRVAW